MLPPHDDREREALERRDGDVTVPFLSGVNEPDGWKLSGAGAWLARWVGERLGWLRST